MYSNRVENNEWTVTTAKCRRKGFWSNNLTKANNTYPLSTANHYQQLTNLQEKLANDTKLKTQGENNTSDISICDRQVKLQHQSRERIQWIDKKKREDFQIYHIPTLVNGKIRNKSIKTVSSVVTYKNSVTKDKLRQHKMTMIGDIFLRGIRGNVELSLSNKIGTHSMVKTGCELNTLLESANGASGSLNQKDEMFICGNWNDLNFDKGESIISWGSLR